VLRPAGTGALLFISGRDLLRLLIHVGYLLVGFWAFTRRSDSPGVRVLTLFCLSMAALMTTGVRTIPDSYAAFAIPGAHVIATALSCCVVFFGMFWLNLALLFPRPVRLVERRSLLFHLVLYMPPVLVAVLALAKVETPGLVRLLLVAVPITAGFIVLGVRRGKARDPLERPQLTLVSYGTGIGMGALLVFVLIGQIPAFASRLSSLASGLMVTFAFLALLLSATSAMPDRRTLWEQLEQRLQEGLGAERLFPLLAVEDEDALQEPEGAVSPFTPASAVVEEMTRTGSAIMVDEARASDREFLTAGEEGWLADRRVSLLLPMSVRGHLVGLLALSLRADHEGLRGEELGLLVSVAAQIGLQSENLRLLEENIQKRHFEEQLATARRVQERFLPRDLPETPGLELAARCIFSLEVAGDYYDVIRLDERRTPQSSPVAQSQMTVWHSLMVSRKS
jgi:GAF domain-containing protein